MAGDRRLETQCKTCRAWMVITFRAEEERPSACPKCGASWKIRPAPQVRSRRELPPI
jgi:predicted Zn-ribbon and HTH transcriptional regulator